MQKHYGLKKKVKELDQDACVYTGRSHLRQIASEGTGVCTVRCDT